MCDRLLVRVFLFVFFKQKTAYELRISDWSSDVCSSDLRYPPHALGHRLGLRASRGLPLRLHGRRPNGGADRTDLVLRTAGWRMSDSQTPARPVKPDYRTPIGRARGLGSAKSGVGHFWWQRVTAVVLALLVPWLVGTLVSFIGADLATVHSVLSTPLNALLLAAFVLALFWPAKPGLQWVIVDHVHTPAPGVTFT